MTEEGWWQFLAYALFFLIPLGFWWLLTRVLQRGRTRTWWSVVTGADGRLSLSRMQAFAWTMIILGSFCAAMIVRPWIVIADKAEVAALEAALKDAKTQADAARKAKDEREIELAKKEAELETARKSLESGGRPALAAAKTAKDIVDGKLAAAEERLKNADAAANAALVKARDAAKAEQAARQADLDAAQKRYDAEEAALTAATAAKVTAGNNLAESEKLLQLRETRENEAEDGFRRTHWVRIPLELLALAGISLATGVFAAAISASGDTGQRPRVQAIAPANPAHLPADSLTTATPTLLQITGTGFGTSGDIRLNGRYARWLSWTETDIYVEVEPNVAYDTITVDTANGKISYTLGSNNTLGVPVVIHESADLFRDDNDPHIFSMTKFQMFAWTIVAIVFYVVVFFSNLDDRIDSLPVVDATVVLLTGLSAGGYLGGKAASNMSPQK